MDQDEFDTTTTPASSTSLTPTPPAPPTPDVVPPLHITEATPPQMSPDAPMTPTVDDGYADTTRVLPAAQPGGPVRTIQPAAYGPDDPLYHDPRLIAERRQPAWPYLAAVLALIMGGVIGFLIGAAGDDDETVPVAPAAEGSDVDTTFDRLLTRTQADGEYKSPSEYPQLDEITAIDTAAATADLENQVVTLTAAQEEAAGQVAALETAVTDITAERDALAAELNESGGTNTDTQADLDAANEQIVTLTSERDTARTQLDEANAALAATQADLEAANATLAELNLMPVPDYTNDDVARARADASENGWTLIEQPTDSTAPAGTVLEQLPAAGANMIEGSVLYVTVAELL